MNISRKKLKEMIIEEYNNILSEKSAISLNLWIKEFERLAKKNRMKPVDFVKKHISKRKGMDNEVVKNVLKHFQKNEGKLTEAKETIFDVAARVMKDKQAHGYKTKKGLVTVDMQTANLLTQVFKKVNPKMKKILSDIGYKNPTQLMNTLWAVAK